MNIVNEDSLQKDLSVKKTEKIYFIYGNDSYLKQYYCDKIGDMACTGDPFFNYQKFESNCNLQDVYDAVKQYPMMADSKCVYLYDYNFLKSDTADFEKLLKIIEEADEGCVFIIRIDSFELDMKKNARVKKIVSQIEKNGGKIVSLDHRTVGKLARMLITGASKRGCSLSDANARHIIELSGEDIALLRNELDKLCAYTKSGEITAAAIDKVCVKSIDASLYDYAGFVMQGKLQEAVKILDELFFMHVEALAILHSLSRAYLEILYVSEGQKKGISIEELAAEWGYKGREFVLRRALQSSKTIDKKKLQKSFDILLECDKKLKDFSGNERLVLEKMTVDLFAVLRGE